MKITSVEVLQINSTINTAGKDGMSRPWRPIIVKVNTDEGVYGLGEVGMAYGIGSSGGWGMAKDFAKILIGQDPFNNEKIWNDMMTRTFWGQGGGTAVFGAMSALDIALWDIKGKVLNQPVYKLLGGKCREDLRCYASQIQFDWANTWKPMLEPEDYGEAAIKAVEDGYDAVKVDLWEFDEVGNMKLTNLRGPLPKNIVKRGIDRIEAIRKAVGDNVDIIVENHAETDTTSAIQLGLALEPYDVMYYEEVNTPLNSMLTKEVKNKVNIPLAGGERIYSRWGYAPFVTDRSLDVLQPDLGTCGGITEGKKIADMAHAYDITIQAHVCGSPIAKAAALHFEIAIPNFIIHEHHRIALMEGNISLCKNDYQPKNGRYVVPELPGIGQDLTKEAYNQATIVKVE